MNITIQLYNKSYILKPLSANFLKKELIILFLPIILIDLKGIIRFKIINELKSDKKYRECEVNYETYLADLNEKKEDLKFSDLELIFKDLKTLFQKRGFIINWQALEKQSLDETINALAMASPFSLEEKQILLEAVSLDLRKNKIAEILSTYTFDEYQNTTLQ